MNMYNICFLFAGLHTTPSSGLKAPYSLKKGNSMIPERFNKLIYGICTVIKCDI